MTMFTGPGLWLRIEGAVVLLCACLLYRYCGANWSMFFILFLWPDLAMAGYLISVKVGAQCYNAAHNYAFPLALGAATYSAPQTHRGLFAFAIIWMAHIGFDRALGYGLKYATFFKDTHLQRVN
jgi:Domain of unknown function (DUF4260)